MRVLMICPELPRADLPGTMAPGARQIESIAALGLDVETVDMSGIPKLKYLQIMPRIRRLARQVDLVHAHFGYCGWLAKLAPALSGSNARLVLSFMGSDLLGTPYNAAGDLEWFSKVMIRVNKRLAPNADQVIVKSKQLGDVIAPTPSTIIPNGVDTSTFRPMDQTNARAKLGLPQDRRLVLFPGNPDSPRKGLPLATAAVESASQLLGQPIDLVKLWKIAPAQVAVYMNACDAMVMTSLLEGSPNVVKEAMACNTPVIGVPVGDVQQLLEGVAGCRFCARDPQQIGSAIVETFNTTEVGARQAIIDRGLDLESVARRIVGVYERALGRSIALPVRQKHSRATSQFVEASP